MNVVTGLKICLKADEHFSLKIVTIFTPYDAYLDMFDSK